MKTPRQIAISDHLWEAFGRIAEEHGLVLIEDAAQAIGAEHGDKRAGSFGLCGTFSFFPSKNLGTLGDGGMITTSDIKISVLVDRNQAETALKAVHAGFDLHREQPAHRVALRVDAVLERVADRGNLRKRDPLAALRRHVDVADVVQAHPLLRLGTREDGDRVLDPAQRFRPQGLALDAHHDPYRQRRRGDRRDHLFRPRGSRGGRRYAMKKVLGSLLAAMMITAAVLIPRSTDSAPMPPVDPSCQEDLDSLVTFLLTLRGARQPYVYQ